MCGTHTHTHAHTPHTYTIKGKLCPRNFPVQGSVGEPLIPTVLSQDFHRKQLRHLPSSFLMRFFSNNFTFILQRLKGQKVNILISCELQLSNKLKNSKNECFSMCSLYSSKSQELHNGILKVKTAMEDHKKENNSHTAGHSQLLSYNITYIIARSAKGKP